MRCEDISDDLSAAADGSALLDRNARRHVERCLRCQAELVQYRKVLRAMRAMRTEVLEPAPGILSDILANLEEAGERRAIRSLIAGHRAAYLGGLAAATAAGAAGAIVFASRARKLRAAS
jgi:anti-sigma factor RsiW